MNSVTAKQGKICTECKDFKIWDAYHRCSKVKDGRINQCKPCRNAIKRRSMRENPAAYAGYSRRYGKKDQSNRLRRIREENYRIKKTEQYRAHNKTGRAIRNGVLIKQPCMICGEYDRAQAHHDNYSRPLDVVWLCQPHHAERHRKLKGS